MSNKYLEKIAGFSLNKALNRTVKYVDDLVGHSARKTRHTAEVLAKAEATGQTAKGQFARANALERRSLRTRIKTGLGVAGVGTTGFLGLHKYHQHKDNAIMAKIDNMYKDPNKDQ